MRWHHLIPILLVLCALTGCEQTALERQADSIRSTTQSEADRIREEGERQADQLEEEGEMLADELEVIDSHWREKYKTRPYYVEGDDYTRYRDAYIFGYRARNKYVDKDWDDVVAQLQLEWEKFKGNVRADWNDMKDAVRDAWDAEYPDR